MTQIITLVPVEKHCGISSVCLGLLHKLKQNNKSVAFFQVIPNDRPGRYGTNELLESDEGVHIIPPISKEKIIEFFSNNNVESFCETLLTLFKKETSDKNIDFIIIEAVMPDDELPFVNKINYAVTSLLDSRLVFIAHPGNQPLNALTKRIHLLSYSYPDQKIDGVILNKVNAPPDYEKVYTFSDIMTGAQSTKHELTKDKALKEFEGFPFKLLGVVPWSTDLISPRLIDVKSYLNADIIHKGDIAERRIKSITFCARGLDNFIPYVRPNTLLVTAYDRSDIIITASLAAMNGVKISGILLTSEGKPNQNVIDLCQKAFNTGLPIISISTNTWETARSLTKLSLNVHINDQERLDITREHVASHIPDSWLKDLLVKKNSFEKESRLNPAAFKYNLLEQAKTLNKRIILPESYDERTIEAAYICAEKGVVTPVLLGDRNEINRIAKQLGLTLSNNIEIISLEDKPPKKYIDRLVSLRKHKGMTDILAEDNLKNPVILATLMLEMGEVDGLVSGAVHTTADTVRPALQLVKTAKGNSIVSSVFFMLLPDQVVIYGDCAINPDPNAEQLAEIALQSAESAKQFGLIPKIAMISYSTGQSGSGVDVDKVRIATEIAKKNAPELIIDGPLQYDAAIIENVARKKAPNSPVAGKANVFIFPDLNTGNTTYKAVQRSADLISIGPMLQGLNKPINDLSRGASVKDIVYTVALTAVQSQKDK